MQGDKILEREYHIRKHKITLHEQPTFQYIVIDCVGNVDEQIAHEVCKILAEFLKQSTETIHFLIDLNQSRETTLKARRVFRSFAEEHIQGRMAFCGLHPVAKVLAGFFLKITNKKDMRFFKTRNEAIQWLRSG